MCARSRLPLPIGRTALATPRPMRLFAAAWRRGPSAPRRSALPRRLHSHRHPRHSPRLLASVAPVALCRLLGASCTTCTAAIRTAHRPHQLATPRRHRLNVNGLTPPPTPLRRPPPRQTSLHVSAPNVASPPTRATFASPPQTSRRRLRLATYAGALGVATAAVSPPLPRLGRFQCRPACLCGRLPRPPWKGLGRGIGWRTDGGSSQARGGVSGDIVIPTPRSIAPADSHFGLDAPPAVRIAIGSANAVGSGASHHHHHDYRRRRLDNEHEGGYGRGRGRRGGNTGRGGGATRMRRYGAVA
ncbi:hypothetical protein B0H10DRAFT_2129425 [Mycena sp. CBHHK59/15]|nr:hypothetical protein B0H10DRAFT_2129425 [Mycena sp. CBHHK59/15]